MHKNFAGGFDCLACPQPCLRA